MSNVYDYIICGFGISGASLAELVCASEKLKNKKILILESNTKPPGFNISYWRESKSEIGLPFQNSWNQILFKFSDNAESRLLLKNYTLYAFSSDWYIDLIKKRIKGRKNVVIKYSCVTSILDRGDWAEVTTSSGEVYKSKIVFDSTASFGGYFQKPLVGGLVFVVKSSKAIFDKKAVVLFDFFDKKHPETFVYMLPVGKRNAVVQLVSFNSIPSKGVIDKWLSKRFPSGNFVVKYLVPPPNNTKNGFYTRKPKGLVVPIGLSSGAMRASTGYAYANTVGHLKCIVEDLVEDRVPAFHKFSKDRPIYKMLDGGFIILSKLYPKLTEMFIKRIATHQNADTILAYMDCRLTLKQILNMV